MKQGSRYSVVITNSGIDKISFGVEAKSSYGNWFTCTAGIETGQTFYKSASETAVDRWKDEKLDGKDQGTYKDPESVMGAGYTGISGEGI